MKREQHGPSSTTVVTDASVLINFLRVSRMDLLGRHPCDFLMTDHVAHEVSGSYADQQEVLVTEPSGMATGREGSWM